MVERVSKKEFVQLLAKHMEVDESIASDWLEGMLDTLYEVFKKGQGVTLSTKIDKRPKGTDHERCFRLRQASSRDKSL